MSESIKVAVAILAFSILGTASGARAAWTCESLFQDQPKDYFAFQSASRRLPREKTENSSAQLLDSVSAILQSLTPAFGDTKGKLYDLRGRRLVLHADLPRVWRTSKGAEIPLSGIFATHAAVSIAYEKIGLPPDFALEFGNRIQRSIIEALGEQWSEYCNFMNAAQSRLEVRLSAERLGEGVRQLSGALEVDRTFDIPYLAGYATDNPNKIYLDRNLTEFITNDRGQNVSIIPFLIVHEFFEKGLLDLLQLKNLSYLRTHQLAQRLEMAAVLGQGVSWEKYQHEFMAAEIVAAEKKPNITRVPGDLDMTPYHDYHETDLIKRMEAAMVTPQSPQSKVRVTQ